MGYKGKCKGWPYGLVSLISKMAWIILSAFKTSNIGHEDSSKSKITIIKGVYHTRTKFVVENV